MVKNINNVQRQSSWEVDQVRNRLSYVSLSALMVFVSKPGWPQFGEGEITSTFPGLSPTVSRPIPEMFYHVRDCLWHLIKTINSISVVLLTVHCPVHTARDIY